MIPADHATAPKDDALDSEASTASCIMTWSHEDYLLDISLPGFPNQAAAERFGRTARAKLLLETDGTLVLEEGTLGRQVVSNNRIEISRLNPTARARKSGSSIPDSNTPQGRRTILSTFTDPSYATYEQEFERLGARVSDWRDIFGSNGGIQFSFLAYGSKSDSQPDGGSEAPQRAGPNGPPRFRTALP